ncbi:DUF4192 domain-containing protein [Knoellia sp. Soil729]|uniref:DUF4192 domain-containing protein n=1 Tax=Knoellia sp. Soil729 TaxID=1736394 RepID=UPI0006F7A6A0|nr:DUF4192 domain-containing protein [Knoellia sp. Soil729]KRE41046.1 hypothetical protein ASG74_14365 [Knoellia sp. Soil729]
MSTAPTIRMRNTADLVALLPHLLGYHPSNALVLVCLREGRICLTAHQPLPPTREIHPALCDLLAGMAKADPEGVIIVGYEVARAAATAINLAAKACSEVGVRVHDRILVTSEGWQSLDTGEASTTAGSTSAAIAELVAAGVAPLASREALAAVLEPTGDAAKVARHIARYTARRDDEDLLELFCSAWPVVLDVRDGAGQVASKIAARAVLAVHDVTVRDLLVARLTPGTIDPDDVPGTMGGAIRSLPSPAWANDTGWDLVRTQSRLQDRLVRLCAMTPDSHAAPPLTVLATWAWWRGDGALSRVAVDRALRCQPDYRLALLLEKMLDLAIPPRR